MFPRIILVTGANGQLGNAFARLEENYPQYRFELTGREVLAIDDEEAVKKYFTRIRPFVCVNCAAYTAVDKAETEVEQAKRVNADAVGFLAAACHEQNSIFIHISTDYVFDGYSSIPYKENDPTNPVNQYGLTKLSGEHLALNMNPDTIIIRTSWVYSEFGNNFVKTMIRLMKERKSINVVEDQVGSPTYAPDLAETIMKIIISNDREPSATGKQATIKNHRSPINGIFHYSNAGSTNWYEFAVAIKEMTGSNCQVNPITSAQYPTPARRPRFSLLDKSKIQAAFELQIPEWKQSLEQCIRRLRG